MDRYTGEEWTALAKLAAYPEPMNVAQFRAFYDTRPDGEKWELLDGELFLNASPVRPHQKIVGSVFFALETIRLQFGAAWEVMPGIGVRLSDFSAVEPDLMIRISDDLVGNMCDDILIAFEVLSPSTRRNDLEFKRINYASLPTLTHYVVISPERIEVRVYARTANWTEARLTRLADQIVFEELGTQLALSAIYANMTKLISAGQV